MPKSNFVAIPTEDARKSDDFDAIARKNVAKAPGARLTIVKPQRRYRIELGDVTARIMGIGEPVSRWSGQVGYGQVQSYRYLTDALEDILKDISAEYRQSKYRELADIAREGESGD